MMNDGFIQNIDGKCCKSRKRLVWLDIMRAFLIIFMVIGHSTSPLVIYIYLFHMPAFFILSGFTFDMDRYKLKDFILKKTITILLPAVLINLIYIFFYSILQELGLYNFIQAGENIQLEKRILAFFQHCTTTDLGGATWFLFVLYEVEIIYGILAKSKKILKKNGVTLLGLILGMVGYYFVTRHIILPYYFDLALLACLYYGIGFLIAQKNVIENIDNKILFPICILLTVFFAEFYFEGNLPMNWPTRSFANLFIQIVSCLAAISPLIYISMKIEKSKIAKWLQWLGQHTYSILILHFLFFRVIFFVGILLGILPANYLQNLVPGYDIAAHGGWLIISIITILGCSIIARLAEKNKILNYIINAKI